ncbi:hypothetical protein M407DRAFT_28560 [Tulasnella calospora MUT 4182]|uniref:Peptidase S28 n=1 Tax=Tulasnella calospora MUT 4182 TaxID=1051891 RepID=A0A0C3KKD4_9AGAM|nr:hypothetical protein M407DRAFT_28560 [Tulasnella calospora MUT 4182]
MLRSLVLVALLGSSISFPAASALERPNYGQQTPRQRRQNPDEPMENDQISEEFFNQLRDHTNTTEGEFRQRYYFSDKYYKGQGSPIIIEIAGEESVDNIAPDLAGDSMMIAMMKAWGAAGVVLERRFSFEQATVLLNIPPFQLTSLSSAVTLSPQDRYFGNSMPRDSLTTSNLKLLTVEQAIEDYKYFVENVKLPWTNNKSYSSDPHSTPWVSIGCSYPGLLVALIQQQYPNLLAAGYSSSAPIKADGDFQDYWKPIEAGMPKNCSADLAATVAHIDHVVSTGTPKEVKKLKTRFGLPDLANDDFGKALQWPLLQWQNISPISTEAEYPRLYSFCDAIERVNGTQSMDPQGVGLDQALENLEREFETSISPMLLDAGLFPTSNPQLEMFTDTSVLDKYARAWTWMLCTQLGWFQVGGTGESSSIASSLVTPDYYARQCSNYFPLADGTLPEYNPSQAAEKFNSRFKSWDVVGKNLFITNGEFDPWRSASYSSERAPPTETKTETHRITVIPNAIHGWDLTLSNGKLDENVKRVQDDGLAQIHDWLQHWYTKHPDVPNNLLGKVNTSGKEDFVDETPNDINATHDTVLHDLEEKMEVLAEAKGWGKIS